MALLVTAVLGGFDGFDRPDPWPRGRAHSPGAWGWGLFDGGGRVPLNFWLFGSHYARSKGPSRSKKAPRKRGSRADLVVLLVVPALENCGVLHARLDSGPSAWPAVVVQLPLQNSASAGLDYIWGGPRSPLGTSPPYQHGELASNCRIPRRCRQNFPLRPSIAVVAPYRTLDALLGVGGLLDNPMFLQMGYCFSGLHPERVETPRRYFHQAEHREMILNISNMAKLTCSDKVRRMVCSHSSNHPAGAA